MKLARQKAEEQVQGTRNHRHSSLTKTPWIRMFLVSIVEQEIPAFVFCDCQDSKLIMLMIIQLRICEYTYMKLSISGIDLIFHDCLETKTEFKLC